MYNYEGCSKSNASDFTTLIHSVRGGCWWSGSRGWTFPTLHYILSLCNRWQHRESEKMASNMEVCMNQSCVTEFLHAEKMAAIDIHSCLLNVYGNQTVDMSTVRQWVMCFSSGDSDAKDMPIPDGHTQPSHHKMKSILIRSPVRTFSWYWLCWKIVLCSWEFALSSVIVVFEVVVVSIVINRRH